MAERFFIATAKDTTFRTDLGPSEMWSAFAVKNDSDKLITVSSLKAKWPLPPRTNRFAPTAGTSNLFGMVDLCRITDYSGGTVISGEKSDTAASNLDSDVKVVKSPDSVTLSGGVSVLTKRCPNSGWNVLSGSMPAYPPAFDEIGMSSLLCSVEGSASAQKITLRQNEGIAFYNHLPSFMPGGTAVVHVTLRRTSGSCFSYSFNVTIKAPDQVLFCVINKDATEVIQIVDVGMYSYGSVQGTSLASPQYHGAFFLQKLPSSVLGRFDTGETVTPVPLDSSFSAPAGLVLKKETDYPIWAQLGDINENMLTSNLGGDNGKSLAAADGICAGLSLVGSLGTRPADPIAWLRPFWQLGVGMELLGAAPLVLRPREVLMVSSPRRFLMNSVSSYQAQKPGIVEHLIDIEMLFSVDDIASGGGSGPTDFAY